MLVIVDCLCEWTLFAVDETRNAGLYHSVALAHWARGRDANMSRTVVPTDGLNLINSSVSVTNKS